MGSLEARSWRQLFSWKLDCPIIDNLFLNLLCRKPTSNTNILVEVEVQVLALLDEVEHFVGVQFRKVALHILVHLSELLFVLQLDQHHLVLDVERQLIFHIEAL